MGERIWREFQFGDLATLLMLETRLENRSNGEEDPLPRVDDDGDGYVCVCLHAWYICMPTCVHTYTTAWSCPWNVLAPPDVAACVHTCMHAYMYAYIHVCRHAYIHAWISAGSHQTALLAQQRTIKRRRICMHTYIHIHAHTHTHTYMHESRQDHVKRLS